MSIITEFNFQQISDCQESILKLEMQLVQAKDNLFDNMVDQLNCGHMFYKSICLVVDEFEKGLTDLEDKYDRYNELISDLEDPLVLEHFSWCGIQFNIDECYAELELIKAKLVE